jgi:hypothetical protein
MKNKTIIHLIYCFAFFMYVDVACFGVYMIHKKTEKVKLERKELKEDVEDLFNYPDLTLYAKA